MLALVGFMVLAYSVNRAINASERVFGCDDAGICEWTQHFTLWRGAGTVLREWKRSDVELRVEKKIKAGRRALVVELSQLTVHNRQSGDVVALSDEFVQGWMRYHEFAARKFNAGQAFRVSCDGKTAPLLGAVLLFCFSMAILFVSFRVLSEEVSTNATTITATKSKAKTD